MGVTSVLVFSLQSLLRSNLLKAVEATLRGEERSCVEVMHLVELLLVLVTEGREALPKVPHGMGIKRTEGVAGGGGGGGSSGGDRSHRQVIEAIRSGNNEEFFETMEAGRLGRRIVMVWEGGR